jgi:nicotinate-nucleotide pyrophosphorylase (carboxylating)
MICLTPAEEQQIKQDVQRSLTEDIGTGDASSSLIDKHLQVSAHVIAREPGVLSGTAWAQACFATLDSNININWHCSDGQRFDAEQVLCDIKGQANAILSAERSALNFLQTLSATATITAQYVAQIADTRARILDTRKTIPGLRVAQKYAVRCGGGMNHRMGLYDAILLKENHIAAVGSIGQAVHKARTLWPHLFIEVEVENLIELEQALTAKADRVLLDNFSLSDIKKAVQITQGSCPLEISGNVQLDNIRAYALTQVDYISVGALTKNIKATDLSLRVQ